ncbi:hypothetical protein QCE62_04610 [Caballeronia sp. LZ033]|uniref:hypothetical protein n=1 Tax=Caballeronia sp. LZ033 TaxID=3038566 RepID=UPI00285D9824|nr:hypothetical protein [Caballeronia sp. LZ033]MDR5812870.1 hypothetical protein [Caballeronia sp. LZ033]
MDLTALLDEDEVTEYESLDIAVHMLFLASSHACEITRKIAIAARDAGFDGVIYPSYYSLLRTGGLPFETVYGMSRRLIRPQADAYVESYTIPNFALFGRQIEQGTIALKCINRFVLTHIGYQGLFGPVVYWSCTALGLAVVQSEPNAFVSKLGAFGIGPIRVHFFNPLMELSYCGSDLFDRS